MSDSHTSTQPNRPGTFYAGEFKKLVPTLIISGLVAFGTSWYNSQQTQTDALRRIEQLEKQVQGSAANIAQNSAALQQNAIRIAEMVIIQNNALEQIKDLKQQQAEIKQQLQNRR